MQCVVLYKSKCVDVRYLCNILYKNILRNHCYISSLCPHRHAVLTKATNVSSHFFPQDDSIQTAAVPCCQQTSIPLLMACTANVKTVVANPIVYLTNLAHDILQTISALDSPPHPDIVNNEVKSSLLSICAYLYSINVHLLEEKC